MWRGIFNTTFLKVNKVIIPQINEKIKYSPTNNIIKLNKIHQVFATYLNIDYKLSQMLLKVLMQ